MGMKLKVKQVVRKDKKSEGITKTFYSCSLEGYDYGKHDVIYANLTLESESQDDLKTIVRQAIGAEVAIDFSYAQTTLDQEWEIKQQEFKEQQKLEAERAPKSPGELLDESIKSVGLKNTKTLVKAAKAIVAGKTSGKTYGVEVCGFEGQA